MGVTLAATWNPRGELPRFQKLCPQLEQVYEALVISFPPGKLLRYWEEVDPQLARSQTKILAVQSPEWGAGRHFALQKALETPAAHIQYADMDRLLRWVETRPEEWRRVVAAIQQHDCLIIGRTEAAYATHPQALIQSERISNLVTSHLLGAPVDVSAGSKGFRRAAVEFLMANCTPGCALGADAEWPVLLQRAGFAIEYVAVDGLDWESADRYQERAAGPEAQRRAVAAYDADPQHWARRVAIALEIVQSGLEASSRGLIR